MQSDAIPEQAAEAIERFPDRRPASLYDVAIQYATLDWYETVTSGELDFELDPKHLAFMTPMKKRELYNDEDNALVVYVDLSDPDNPTFRDQEPVRFETIDESYRYRLGHAYPTGRSGVMTDYSVTTYKEASERHLSGVVDKWSVTSTIQDRFDRWAQSEEAEAVKESEDVEDSWIIEALQKIGDDEEKLDELVNRQDFPLDPTDDETKHDVFVTIRVKLPSSEEYLWPGEISAINEVMVAQKADRFEKINVDVPAASDGVGYISESQERVTGGSSGLLGMYAIKQREHLPDLSVNGSEAWRIRGVTHETAAALATASSVIDEFYEDLGAGRRLYILPFLDAHPEQIEPADFAAFASDVFQQLRNAPADTFETTVDEIFYRKNRQSDATDESLGLFANEDSGDAYANVGVASAFTVEGNPKRVYFESLRTDVYRPHKVDIAHGEVLREDPFSGSGIFADIREQSNSPLLAPEARRDAMALFGGYFDWTTEPTRTSEESDDTPKAGDIDDVRARRLRQFLTGDQIAIATLLEEYLHKIVQEQRNSFGDDSRQNFPTFKVLEQYAQLRALHNIGALTDGTQSEPVESTGNHTCPSIATMTQQHSEADYESREERLTAFIEDHDVLAESEPHQAVFLLGGLVGRITALQRHPDKDVSSTLVRRYPIDYLTKQTVKEVTKEVLQMNNTYIEADDELPSTYNARYVNLLPDMMLDSDPSSWKISQNELQWIYSLGIAYGSNDTSVNSEEEE